MLSFSLHSKTYWVVFVNTLLGYNSGLFEFCHIMSSGVWGKGKTIKLQAKG